MRVHEERVVDGVRRAAACIFIAIAPLVGLCAPAAQAGDDRRAAAIEAQAAEMVAAGARAEAVRYLRFELDDTANAPIVKRLQTALQLTTLEGRAAPRLDAGLHAGPRTPTLDQLKGRVVLLFFWAHWCSQCREDGPMVARLLQKYGDRGLTIVAPTQRYGYVETGRPAPPARELRHIVAVRDKHYPFLRGRPVPIGEANYAAYGVTTIPMYVVIDREGVTRLYHAGRIAEPDLDAAIRSLL
jgi:thiol-disulfide isomerase/thioredoxin